MTRLVTSDKFLPLTTFPAAPSPAPRGAGGRRVGIAASSQGGRSLLRYLMGNTGGAFLAHPAEWEFPSTQGHDKTDLSRAGFALRLTVRTKQLSRSGRNDPLRSDGVAFPRLLRSAALAGPLLPMSYSSWSWFGALGGTYCSDHPRAVGINPQSRWLHIQLHFLLFMSFPCPRVFSTPAFPHCLPFVLLLNLF